MIWIMCVFFAVFFAVSYATRSDEKIQAQRLKIIENCKLKQVEATSFDRQNGILTVVKRFGDGYQERSRYCLSLLPALNAGKARSGKGPVHQVLRHRFHHGPRRQDQRSEAALIISIQKTGTVSTVPVLFLVANWGSYGYIYLW